ncbi:MAG: HEPN domain-containing protein [Nanoarchaeota archaeon]|nr:HEPN domain-containing protein [Nanoarchaeota archaeon]MBU1005198.1 HEPN domain-containing protein [Nanoarchaeota archaeon]MBU1946869.1 HEPN domain-containing protein [Nanoarchaeota archaeon]
MGQIENKLRWCLNKAEKEGEKHRGLKKVQPSVESANDYIKKAIHNLTVMQYLMKGGFVDWAVSACFYTMYHCLLAILAKNGYESRNQECTFAAVEVLIKEKKSGISLEQLKKIASFDEKSASDEIINLREKFQYGTETILDTSIVKKLVDEAKEFIEAVREDLKR